MARTRDPLERYDTPHKTTRTFLDAWGLPFGGAVHIVEPAAGEGKMLDVIGKRWPSAQITAWDIQPRHADVVELNFLTADLQEGWARLVITNPPFTTAMEFLKQSLHITQRGGYVVLFLRLAFFETRKRNAWLRAHMPERIYVCPQRPRFTGPNTNGKDTDRWAYGWFVWRKGHYPEAAQLFILPW